MTGSGITAVVLASMSAAAVGACGGGMAALQSRPLDEPVTVDASQSEWWGALTEIGSDLSVGFRNDAEYLYLTLTTDDEDLVNQIMFQGLVVWFDPTGQKAESFGIRFPLGALAAGPPGSGPGGGIGAGRQPGAGAIDGGELDPVTRDAMYERSMSGGSVLTASGDTVRIASGSAIEFEGRAEYGGFVYELRAPLRTGPETPYAIGAEPGQTIAIGFTTPEIDMDELYDRARESGDGGGGRPSGGAGRPSGGGFGGGPPGGGGRGFSIPSPLEEWTSVTLAN